jgi:NAD(P)-dependent dehydrogenase (short-subunit alcohol dehydrogenase family)
LFVRAAGRTIEPGGSSDDETLKWETFLRPVRLNRVTRNNSQNIVITGASAGVGRAVVRRFARDGANIGLIARERTRLDEAASEVETLGGAAIALPADVADAEQVETAASLFEERFGPIDIWINCAMATVLAPVYETTPEEFRRVTEVTYLGCVHGTLAALARMRRLGRGTIVQVGSALAYRSIPLQAPYCAAKHAIVGFTDSLRSELIHERSPIKLTVVHLPGVNTPQFEWARNKMPNRPQPVPPIFQPEVAADGIHYAALHPRRELWVGRSSYMVILGQKLFPGYLDRKMARAAFGGQQTDEPAEQRPDNLFDPVPGAYDAHGRFDRRATSVSPALWLAEHRNGVASMLGLVALGAIAALAARAIDRTR